MCVYYATAGVGGERGGGGGGGGDGVEYIGIYPIPISVPFVSSNKHIFPKHRQVQHSNTQAQLTNSLLTTSHSYSC